MTRKEFLVTWEPQLQCDDGFIFASDLDALLRVERADLAETLRDLLLVLAPGMPTLLDVAVDRARAALSRAGVSEGGE